MQADGRAQRKAGKVRPAEVEGTDVGIQPRRDQADHVVKGFAQVMGTRDDLRNIREECDSIRNGAPPSAPHSTEAERA